MKFSLTKRQAKGYRLARDGKQRVIVFGGAIRGGKTWWLLLTLSALALKYPRSRWVVIRKTYAHLKRTTYPSFESLLHNGLQQYVRSFTNGICKFKNNSELIFMAESYADDKELNRFRGLEINGAGLDEVNELQEVTFYKVQERIGSWNQAEGNPPIVCLATCNPANNWVKTLIYERYKNNTLPPKWSYISSKITDNPYLSEDYLDSLKELPHVQYQRFVEGDWDVMDDVENPFLYNWDDTKHIDDSIGLNEHAPVYFCIDFNINPLCAIIIQERTGGANVLDEIKIDKGSIDALCDRIEGYGVQSGLIRICGDAMGNGGSVFQRDNASAYLTIKRRLKLSDKQLIIPANPKHKNSRVDCNNALKKLNIKVNSNKCKGFIYDAKQVQCDSEGGIIKSNRKNLSERADFLDCFRYFVNAILKKHL